MELVNQHNGRPRISVVVLTHNRPEYLALSLRSVQQQINTGFILNCTVSDNSDNDDTQALCAEQFPSVKYVRRPAGMSSSNHFRTVISENTDDFLVLFHDDDILHPDYVGILLAEFERDPQVAAVACNAYVIDQNGYLIGRRFNRQRGPLRLFREIDVANQYLPGGRGCAPFPSYMYRRGVLSPEMLDTSPGGKYADVSLLASITRKGKVLWLPNRLMSYRIHGTNDSSTFARADHLSLCRYMISIGVNPLDPRFRAFRHQGITFDFFTIISKLSKRKKFRAWVPIIPSGMKSTIVQRSIYRSPALPRYSRMRFRLGIGLCIAMFESVFPRWLRLPDGIFIRLEKKNWHIA